MKRSFRMITWKQILPQICLGDWFMSLDLKDTYFYIQVAPHHRRFMRFAVKGVAYQYKALPWGSALHPLTVQRIWEIFDMVRVDLFASKDNSHCPIFFTRSTDALAHEWSSLPFYAFPPVALLPQVLRRVREQRHKLILISPLWRNQLWASGVIPAAESSPVTDPLETGPPLSSERHELWALHVWPLNGSLSSS